MRITIITALLIFSLSATANNEVLLAFDQRQGENELLIFTISKADYLKLPDWEPSDGHPPISIGQAQEIALKNNSGYKVSKILILNRENSGKKVWFYMFTLDAIIKNEHVFRNEVVLMNGRLVQPSKASESELYESIIPSQR